MLTNAPRAYRSNLSALYVLAGIVFLALAMFVLLADAHGFRFFQLLPRSWFVPVIAFACTFGLALLGIGLGKLLRGRLRMNGNRTSRVPASEKMLTVVIAGFLLHVLARLLAIAGIYGAAVPVTPVRVLNLTSYAVMALGLLGMVTVRRLRRTPGCVCPRELIAAVQDELARSVLLVLSAMLGTAFLVCVPAMTQHGTMPATLLSAVAAGVICPMALLAFWRIWVMIARSHALRRAHEACPA